MTIVQTDVKPVRRQTAEMALESYWLNEISGAIDTYDAEKVQELANLPWANINRQRPVGGNYAPLWMSIPRDRRYGYHNSAQDNEIKEMIFETLISVSGIDINLAINDDGCTALIEAATRGDLKRIRRLLNIPGIDVNKPDKYGEPALIKVLDNHASQDFPQIVFTLLAQPELDVNVYDRKERPALYLAFEHFLFTIACIDFHRKTGQSSLSDGDPTIFWALHDDPRSKKTNVEEAIKAGRNDKTYGPGHHLFETSKAQLINEFMNSKDQQRFPAALTGGSQGTKGAAHAIPT